MPKTSIKWEAAFCNMTAEELADNPGEAEYYTKILSDKELQSKDFDSNHFVSAIKI